LAASRANSSASGGLRAPIRATPSAPKAPPCGCRSCSCCATPAAGPKIRNDLQPEHNHKEKSVSSYNDRTRARRRQFLKLSSMFTAIGALPLLQLSQAARAAEPDAPLRIGYLPITDATPLLVAHHNKLFQDQGLEVEKPRMFRSWAQIVEAFLAGQVNAVHLLSPMTVWARYGSKSPAKIVAWNHMSGSGLTVQPDVNSLEDLGGTTVAIPFWYSLHNVV